MRRLIAALVLAALGAAAPAADLAPPAASVGPGVNLAGTPVEWLQADIERTYDALPPAPAGRFAVRVDAADDLVVSGEAGGRLHLLYRMNFNQVAEGWSWQPQADPAVADYYRFKFLPLGTRVREQGAPYVQEDLPGRPREVKRVWQYDYFFAFDNPYDFFARPTVEDDAGFVAEVTVAPERVKDLQQAGRIGMLALGHFAEAGRAESTTFWKATDGKPVDMTLKNRYLLGKLDEVWFVDTVGGEVLARLTPRGSPR